MLNRVDVIKKDGRVLTLPIYDPSSFLIKDIQGLDPVKANVVTSNFSQMDGTQYQTSRREMRNLVFKLGIDSSNSVSTVQELRKQLYDFLLPKTDVQFRFIQDGLLDVIIHGHVESFESPLFVKDPEATISILCFDPDFINEIPDVISGLMVLSSDTNTNDILYTGEVDAGFEFKLFVNQTITEFSIQNTLTDGTTRTMNISSVANPLVLDDEITISTIPGNKFVYLKRGGISSSILWAMDPASDWLKLYPGLNKIKVSSTVNETAYTITYNDRFG